VPDNDLHIYIDTVGCFEGNEIFTGDLSQEEVEKRINDTVFAACQKASEYIKNLGKQASAKTGTSLKTIGSGAKTKNQNPIKYYDGANFQLPFGAMPEYFGMKYGIVFGNVNIKVNPNAIRAFTTLSGYRYIACFDRTGGFFGYYLSKDLTTKYDPNSNIDFYEQSTGKLGVGNSSIVTDEDYNAGSLYNYSTGSYDPSYMIGQANCLSPGVNVNVKPSSGTIIQYDEAGFGFGFLAGISQGKMAGHAFDQIGITDFNASNFVCALVNQSFDENKAQPIIGADVGWHWGTKYSHEDSFELAFEDIESSGYELQVDPGIAAGKLELGFEPGLSESDLSSGYIGGFGLGGIFKAGRQWDITRAISMTYEEVGKYGDPGDLELSEETPVEKNGRYYSTIGKRDWDDHYHALLVVSCDSKQEGSTIWKSHVIPGLEHTYANMVPTNKWQTEAYRKAQGFD
jgi:hypothetical protein